MAAKRIDQKGYSFYVFDTVKNKILSGWEFRSDAKDYVDEKAVPGLKIYTRSFLKSKGIDPKKNDSWGSELGLVKYKPIPEVVLSGDFRKTIQIPEIKLRFNKGKTFGKIADSNSVYQFLLKVFGNQISIQEHFVVLLFDNGLNILGYYKHTVGTPVSTLADIPMIMGVVLKTMARSFIISHNHPSGNRTPSDADRILTSSVRQAANSLKLSMIDHLIVTKNNGYYSFADEGHLSSLAGYSKQAIRKEDIEKELREEILLQLKKVNSKPQLTPGIHHIIQSEKGYRWMENRIIQMMISDGVTVSAAIPQIEMEL